MTVAQVTTHAKVKVLAAKKAVVTVAKSFWVYVSILCGLSCEFAMGYLNDSYHWTVSQPLSSALYSATCITLFYFYNLTYSNRVLILSFLSGIYGLLLLITLNGTCYTILNGFIWGDSLNFYLSYSLVNIEVGLNFKFLYRLAEVLIIVRTLWDARIINRVCNSSFYTSIRSHVFGGKNSFTGAL